MTLVEITPKSHNLLLDLRYATVDNFTGKPIYSRASCYLHPEAEACLRQTVQLAANIHLKVKIFDAFRPSEAQWALWHHTPDPTYISDPRRGSPHSRGAAVDLTLVDESGRELPMGTPFDDLSAASHHGSTEISVEARKNRLLLLGLMTDSGWDFFRNEWWHYQLFDARRLPVLDDRVTPSPMMADSYDLP
ncbi:MAG: D-alanyl-D-alanine dipeptidase [Magnetospiraceae bacterium]